MPDPTLLRSLEERATALRKHVLTMASGGQRIHLGGSISIADLMAALFFHFLRVEGGDRPRDHFILSKGHAVHAFHACLAELGSGRLRRLGLEDRFIVEVADYPDILKLAGLDALSIAAAARSLLA